MKSLYTALWFCLQYSLLRFVVGFDIENSIIIAILTILTIKIDEILERKTDK